MKTKIILILGVIGLLIGCQQTTSNSSTDTINMKDMNMKNEKFVGTLELKEWTATLPDESVVFPFGEDAIGRITYDRSGNMAVQVMKNNRSQFLSEDPLQAQPDEVVAAYSGFIGYCGNYEVNRDSKKVVHQIKISSFPNWVGQGQIRNFEFNEDELILSTDLIGSSRHKLVWRKIDN